MEETIISKERKKAYDKGFLSGIKKGFLDGIRACKREHPQNEKFSKAITKSVSKPKFNLEEHFCPTPGCGKYWITKETGVHNGHLWGCPLDPGQNAPLLA